MTRIGGGDIRPDPLPRPQAVTPGIDRAHREPLEPEPFEEVVVDEVLVEPLDVDDIVSVMDFRQDRRGRPDRPILILDVGIVFGKDIQSRVFLGIPGNGRVFRADDRPREVGRRRHDFPVRPISRIQGLDQAVLPRQAQGNAVINARIERNVPRTKRKHPGTGLNALRRPDEPRQAEGAGIAISVNIAGRMLLISPPDFAAVTALNGTATDSTATTHKSRRSPQQRGPVGDDPLPDEEEG